MAVFASRASLLFPHLAPLARLAASLLSSADTPAHRARPAFALASSGITSPHFGHSVAMLFGLDNKVGNVKQPDAPRAIRYRAEEKHSIIRRPLLILKILVNPVVKPRPVRVSFCPARVCAL